MAEAPPAGVPSLRRAWVEIDLAALARNYHRLVARVAPARIVAVVKADAYGHGATAVARALEPLGVAAFAVALAEEAIELRQAGVGTAILVLSPVPEEAYDSLAEHRLTPAVSGLDQLRSLAGWAAATGWRGDVHLKFDTGMTRLGIEPEAAGEAFGILRAHPSLRFAGVLSHLAEAESPESPANSRQLDRFLAVLALLRAEERRQVAVHLANSAAALHLPASHFDLVRLGLSLYGYDPADRAAVELEPVLAVQAELVQVREIPAGTRAGYGGRWVADRPSRVGVVPVGYADGYSWRLGNRAEALVRSRRVPVAGSVSMDMLLVDLTDSGGDVGERVTLLGRQDGASVTARELAARVGTVPYQMLCLFGLRLPRRVLTSASGAPEAASRGSGR